MKFFYFFLLVNFQLLAQSSFNYPIIEGCRSVSTEDLETCFKTEFYNFFLNNLNLQKIKEGNSDLIFEINENSKLNLLYVSSNDIDVNTISEIIENIKIIKPAVSNGKFILTKYTINLVFPLEKINLGTVIANYNVILQTNSDVKKNTIFFDKILKESSELDDVNIKFFDNLYNTNLSIPFTHERYNEFEFSTNIVGQNSHTGSKPFTFKEINKYYDFSFKEKSFKKTTNSWISRKIFNENLVEISGNGYWFTINPIINLQIGKENNISGITYLNSRAITLQGQLGKNLNFSSTVFETQGNFANYYNDYAKSIKPGNGSPAIIPGIGAAKIFKTSDFDIPSADALITYQANDFVNINLGYGRNFIGDGYRSLLLSDGASPYTFVKINTIFWKIKYTNIYGWLRDVRPETYIDGTFTTKYMTSHYLSYNVTKRLNIGLFESVIWSNANNRGFDANFINPIIFYRSIEFASSPKNGNAIIGLTSKYKFNNQFNLYGQFLIDEFAIDDVLNINNSWRNKFAYQLGLKYYNVLNLKNFNLQIEYNKVRPYVYSHSNPITNYAHYNQSLGHNWGSNFQEIIFSANYNYNRWFTNIRINYANRGFDFNTLDNNFNYGSNIYKDYDDNRFSDDNVTVGQGLLKNQFIIEHQIKYLINYKTNLNIFINSIYININEQKNKTIWLNIGVKSEIFNYYVDY
jgi:hypothetical protein